MAGDEKALKNPQSPAGKTLNHSTSFSKKLKKVHSALLIKISFSFTTINKLTCNNRI